MHEKGKLRSNQFWSALKIPRLLAGNQILLALLASGLIGHSLSLLKSCNYFSEILPLTCNIKTLDMNIVNLYVRVSGVSYISLGLLAFNYRLYPCHRPAYPKSVISRLVYVVISVVQNSKLYVVTYLSCIVVSF